MHRAALLTLLLTLAAPVLGGPAGTDLHAHWDQRCKDCHGHSADFAQRFLKVENGRLVGAHHRQNLAEFLRNHYLNDDLVAPVMAMLSAQVSTPPLFREHCARCHGSAAEFARQSLVMREGGLVSLPAGRKLADTLSSHGGLAPRDVPILVESLARVRKEVSTSSP